MKTEHPILMCAEMVRAILAGRKTQTRRVIKFQDHACLTGDCPHTKQSECNAAMQAACPYGQVGDGLWVKETFAWHPEFPLEKIYRADRGGDYQGAAQGDFKWKPSIFMPREASRIILKVSEARFETVQRITEADALVEGVQKIGNVFLCDTRQPGDCRPGSGFGSARLAYRCLWNAINLKPKPVYERVATGKKCIVSHVSHPWCREDLEAAYPGVESGRYRGLPITIHENPWVWVVGFGVERVTGKRN